MSWVPPNHGDVRDKLSYDADSELRAGCVIASLLMEYPEVYVRASSSRRGFQIVVDAPQDLVKRWEIGDCFGRLHGDMRRMKVGLPIGILFYYKNRKRTTRWKRIVAEVIN